MLLEKKVCLVTGANRGLGSAIVDLFLKNGAEVIPSARNESESFTNCLKSLEIKYGEKIKKPLYFDLTDTDSIKNAVKEIISRKLAVNVLVNNAGAAIGSTIQMTSRKDLESMMSVNFFGQIMLTQNIVRLLAKSGSASIINISSTAGFLADAGTLAYGASKASLSFATKVMAKEFAPLGIRVNAIAPIVAKTDMFDQMNEHSRSELISRSAMKRACEPDEIANIAVFLASDMSSILTGQIINADGGL